MSLSSDFIISLFIFFVLITILYSLLSYSNSSYYFPSLNYNVLKSNAHYNSLFVMLNSYSIKHGFNNDYQVDCVVSDKVYCINDELNLTGESPVYLRRGGGN